MGVEPATAAEAASGKKKATKPKAVADTSVEETRYRRTGAFLDALRHTRNEIAKAVVGQSDVVDQLLIALICGGHVLLEGAPGVGKTLLVRTLGTATGLSFARIQFTPDLMPADVTGSLSLTPDESGHSRLEFQPGPIFTQLLLADEINRATPKTQSSLLEAMQEHTVTAAGRSMKLPEPFFVLATQNPIEMEGTYRLPEAQIDRFLFKSIVHYPSEAELDAILDLTTGTEQSRAGARAPARGYPHAAEARASGSDRRPCAPCDRAFCAVDAAGSARRARSSSALFPLWPQPARGAVARPCGEGQRVARRPLQCQL